MSARPVVLTLHLVLALCLVWITLRIGLRFGESLGSGYIGVGGRLAIGMVAVSTILAAGVAAALWQSRRAIRPGYLLLVDALTIFAIVTVLSPMVFADSSPIIALGIAVTSVASLAIYVVWARG